MPFVIRGPGIPKKSVEKYPITSVDIAPTILDLAEIPLPLVLDGESIKTVLFSKTDIQFRKRIFVEYWGEENVATVDKECNLDFDHQLAVSYSSLIR